MEDITKLAEEIKQSLSDYCANECGSFCCRKGYLTLKEEEVELICGKDKEELIKRGELIELSNGKFSLNLQNFLGSCPQLKNFRCLIHKNENRPATCKDFPIFIAGREIKISSRCPAKKDNKFFEFERKAKEKGYTFVESLFRI